MPPRSVFITGASSGLGRGLALHYALAGATVHAAARRLPLLEALAAEARARGAPGSIVPVRLDVADSEALAAALAESRHACGGVLDLVVANAGVSEPTPASAMDWRAVKRVLDVNVSAACVTVAAALPAMVQRQAGTVVAISSLAGSRGFPGFAGYCASKAALHVFMESVRVDLGGSGVRALTVYPGFVKTEMTARNDCFMPFLMDLDEAVRLMARGIERGDPVISFPLPLATAARLARGIPRALYESLARRAPRSWSRPDRAP